MHPVDIPQISELSIPEKIVFVEELWDDISINESEIGIPSSHKIELNKRLELNKNNPEKLLTLEKLRTNISKRK